jgi:hypothetical protein
MMDVYLMLFGAFAVMALMLAAAVVMAARGDE